MAKRDSQKSIHTTAGQMPRTNLMSIREFNIIESSQVEPSEPQSMAQFIKRDQQRLNSLLQPDHNNFSLKNFKFAQNNEDIQVMKSQRRSMASIQANEPSGYTQISRANASQVSQSQARGHQSMTSMFSDKDQLGQMSMQSTISKARYKLNMLARDHSHDGDNKKEYYKQLKYLRNASLYYMGKGKGKKKDPRHLAKKIYDKMVDAE